MSKLVNMHGWNAERRIDGIRDFVSELVKISQENSWGRMKRLKSGLILLEECLKEPTKLTMASIQKRSVGEFLGGEK